MNPPTIEFGVAEHWVGRGVVVAVCGDLDLATAHKLADAIEAAARKKPAALIVDLSRVDFLASVGMTVLVTAHREIAPSARFGVVADGPSTGRPLKMIGIDTIVDVYRTLDDALMNSHRAEVGARAESEPECCVCAHSDSTAASLVLAV